MIKPKIKRRRRPHISIIISSDNNAENLGNCLNSFVSVNNESHNIEFVVINNFSEDENSINEIKWLLNKYKDMNIVFYQSQYLINKSQSRNLGIDLSRGSWLYFVDDDEVALPKFNMFLSNFKFDLQKAFYRVPSINENNKKTKIQFIKNRFFSTLASSFIINAEFLEYIKLKWESRVNIGETFLFLREIYLAKNINYVYLKKHYSTIHNHIIDKNDYATIDIEEIERTYYVLREGEKRKHKELIILFLSEYIKSQEKDEHYDAKVKKVKKFLKEARIHFIHFIFLGPSKFFKTISLYWIMLFG